MTFEDKLKRIVLLFDASASMAFIPKNTLKTLEPIIENLKNDHGKDVKLDLYYFGDYLDENKINCTLENHSEKINYDSNWKSDMGNTALFDSVFKILSLIKKYEEKTLLFIITDGENNYGEKNDKSEIYEDLISFKNDGNKLFIIGIRDYTKNVFHNLQDHIIELDIDNFHEDLHTTLSDSGIFSAKLNESIN